MRLYAFENFLYAEARAKWLFYGTLFLLAGISFPLQAGVALRLYYRNIPGVSIAKMAKDSAFPDKPSAVEPVTESLEGFGVSGDHFGTWTRGYLVPPETGDYVFFLASDNQSELWLSEDHLVENRKRIATNLNHVKPRDYNASATQQSITIPLAKGRQYYFELWHKEDVGDAHVSVVWQLPGGGREPVSSAYLLPFPVNDFYHSVSNKAPAILNRYFQRAVPALTNTTAQEGSNVTLAVTVEATPPVSFQWFCNRELIPGADLPYFRLARAGVEHDVNLYSVVVSNKFGVARAEAVLSVLPVQPPTVLSVLNLGISNQFAVFFSEAVETSSAGNKKNYSMKGVTASKATVVSSNIVMLEIERPFLDNNFLQVENVRSAASPARVTSTSVEVEAGLNFWLRFEESDGLNLHDSSGNGVPASLGNRLMHTADGRIGAGVNFNGSSDYVVLPEGVSDFNGGITIALWAKPTAVKHYARFLEFGNGVLSDNVIFGRIAKTDHLFFEGYHGRISDGKVAANGAIQLDRWQHFGVSMDSVGRVKLYKNGSLIAEQTTVVPAILPRLKSYIGRSNWPADVDDYFEGGMDEVRMYGRALSADEIKVLARGAF